MTWTLDSTVGGIVAADYRTAAVFERHAVDFCCGGRKTLAQACDTAGAAPAAVLRDLQELPVGTDDAPDFGAWDLRALIDHIVKKHHAYVREALPHLSAHARKIAEVHGQRHPELVRVAVLVDDIASEMTSHMMKEERILFPYIAEAVGAAAAGLPAPTAPFGSVANPIRAMEHEHESTGHAMLEIRELTDGYRPPADACGTYRVCLHELEAFEKDLHAHVHLENNLLFPKAQTL